MPDPVVALHGLATKLTLILPIIAVGLALEALKRAPPPASLRLNLSLTALFAVSDAVLGATVAAWTIRLIAGMPGAGALRLPLPAWALVPAWLLSADFCYYWLHRAQHHFSVLWVQHEIHHADEHVNVASAHRHHWLEAPLQASVIAAPLAYLLAPPPGVAWTVALVSTTMALAVHLDLPIGLARWNWLVTTPQSHRLHHSLNVSHHDKNFAAMFPLYDVLFGTYVQPPRETITTGLDGVRFTNVRDATSHPFRRWWQMLH